MAEGGTSQEKPYKIVAVYDNHRANAGPFLRGPLLETDEKEPYWITVGFQLTPGSEHVWMRYPNDDVTVVQIGVTSEEGHHSPLLLGFSYLQDEEQDVLLKDGTSRSAHTAEKP